MTRLAIRLLGGFHVSLNDTPVDFPTQRARALLAYLAAENELAHTRTQLAGLLWPAHPEKRARAYLRQALADVRKSIHDGEGETPFFLITNQAIQLNPLAGQRVDVTTIRRALAEAGTVAPFSAHTATALAAAVDGYRGRFLEGFFLKGCTDFEEWQLLTAETSQRQVVDALSRLDQYNEHAGELDVARRYAWRQAELEPLSDDANGSLIRLLATNGDPAAALAHYHSFAELLSQELDTTPAPEIRRLADQLIAKQATSVHKIAPRRAAAGLPPFLPDRPKNRPEPPD